MARSTAQIQAQILSNLQTNYGQVGQPFYYYFNDANANPITPSQTSIVMILIYILSAAMNLFEQFNDLFLSNVETQVTNAPVFSAPWYQNQLLNFQYSSSSPQLVSQNPSTFAVFYAVVNAALRIITQAAVIPTNNRTINIKVASNSAPLSSPQITAVKSFLTAIGIPGTQFNIISENADQLFTQATVYYDATYSGVISANLLAAYDAFLAAIPFNGTFEVSQLQEALMAVPGVKDVVFNTLKAIPPIGSPVYLYETIGGNPTLLNRNWATVAGYIIDDTTIGQDFVSNLTLVAA